ncbi:MAG: hypothetical protein DRH12_19025 [Deltaproteobacteria bacterium]|nr:MAG: hypothetical protein DRH12_19025 [Deltaproteobacteria bacterium]
MAYFIHSRNLRASLLLACVIGFCTVVYLGFATRSHLPFSPDTKSAEAPPLSLATRQNIEGFRFDGYKNGNKVISIEADRFSIQKKKLGFLRLGLLNEARLQNGFIRIFCHSPTELFPNQNHPSLINNPSVSFQHIVSKESLPPMPVKRLSSIVIAPIHLELYRNQVLVSKISADYAKIRLVKSDIVFKGNVVLTSATRILTTNFLTFNPTSGTIECKGKYLLNRHGHNISGRHLITDVLLLKSS